MLLYLFLTYNVLKYRHRIRTFLFRNQTPAPRLHNPAKNESMGELLRENIQKQPLNLPNFIQDRQMIFLILHQLLCQLV